MKKLIWIVLTFLIFIGSLSFKVQAETNYDMTCGLYEVDYINDDGSFSKDNCYNDYNSAKNRMKELGGDTVVRHKDGYSPTKIIAMNSGLVLSYPRTGATLNIYEDASVHDIYHKQTYIARHYQMNYVDTERYLNNGTGMIEVNINGFHGYTDLEYTDLVPSKYIRNNIPIKVGGNNLYTHEDSYWVTVSQNYYEVIQNGNYKDLVYHIFYGYPESNGKAIEESIVYGPASDEMPVGAKYYSQDGTSLYINDSFTEGKITYYNYYQYLPLRSKTNIPSDVLNSFISKYNGSVMNGTGQTFIDAQNKYGINALLLFSMAVHESGGGTSGYATKRNNLFGWNAVDANPDNATYFNSVADCVNEQAGINLRGFVDITDGRFFSSSLGNKGSGLNVKYASDPYWGMEIASIAYQIDKLSKNKDGSLTDYNYYSLSLIKDFDISIKKAASDNADTLYTTAYGPSYQKDFIVITLGEENGWTKIQSTNSVDDNYNIKTHRTPITTGSLNPISYGEYNFEKSIGYIKTSSLQAINKDEKEKVVEEDLTMMFNLESMTIENNNLNLSGNAFIKGIDATDLSKVSQTINIINLLDGSIVKSYSCNINEYKGISFNDGHTYNYVGFSVSLPIKELSEGDYYLSITVNNSGYSFSETIFSYQDFAKNLVYTDNDYTYRINVNDKYANRLDFSIVSLPSSINYASINKPNNTFRNSLMSLDHLTLDNSLNLSLDGQAMMYYTNYDNVSAIKTTLYLVDSVNNYYEIVGENYKSSFDFTSAFSSSYNLDYISYKVNGNITLLGKGTYMLIMKLENGEYIDYVEVNNINEVSLPSVEYNGLTYRFFTSKTRNRLMLEVK